MSVQFHQNQDFIYLKSDLLDDSTVAHCYCTKQGGTSNGDHASMSFRYTGGNNKESVHANFAIVAQELGGTFDDIVRTQQVHKAKVVRVDDAAGGYRIVATDNDGLITNLPGVILSGFYADCQVILYHDPANKAIGVAHSGWRGTVLNISKEIITQMAAAYGTDPAQVRCVIGPAICQDCFACDVDVVQAFQAAYGNSVLPHIKQIGAKYHPNLGAITKDRLVELGVLAQNIDICTVCTHCDDGQLFWSHRKVGDKRGVHGGFLRLRP